MLEKILETTSRLILFITGVFWLYTRCPGLVVGVAFMTGFFTVIAVGKAAYIDNKTTQN